MRSKLVNSCGTILVGPSSVLLTNYLPVYVRFSCSQKWWQINFAYQNEVTVSQTCGNDGDEEGGRQQKPTNIQLLE